MWRSVTREKRERGDHEQNSAIGNDDVLPPPSYYFVAPVSCDRGSHSYEYAHVSTHCHVRPSVHTDVHIDKQPDQENSRRKRETRTGTNAHLIERRHNKACCNARSKRTGADELFIIHIHIHTHTFVLTRMPYVSVVIAHASQHCCSSEREDECA